MTRGALAPNLGYWSLVPFLPASSRCSGIFLSSNQHPISLPVVVPGLRVRNVRKQEEEHTANEIEYSTNIKTHLFQPADSTT